MCVVYSNDLPTKLGKYLYLQEETSSWVERKLNTYSDYIFSFFSCGNNVETVFKSNSGTKDFFLNFELTYMKI